MSEEQPSPAVQTTPEVVRSGGRRMVLAVLVIGVVAAIAICLVVLDGFAARLATTQDPGGSSAIELVDCNELYREWTQTWLDEQLARIRDAKGDDASGMAMPWRTPDQFPSAALAWAGIEPACGSTMVVDSDDSVWAYRMEVVEVTESQFEAVSSLLAAMGYSLTYDQVPRELLQVGEIAPEADAPESEDSQAGGEQSVTWYREFANADGWFWMTFFPLDADAEVRSGELVIGYQTAD